MEPIGKGKPWGADDHVHPSAYVDEGLFYPVYASHPSCEEPFPLLPFPFFKPPQGVMGLGALPGFGQDPFCLGMAAFYVEFNRLCLACGLGKEIGLREEVLLPSGELLSGEFARVHGDDRDPAPFPVGEGLRPLKGEPDLAFEELNAGMIPLLLGKEPAVIFEERDPSCLVLSPVRH